MDLSTDDLLWDAWTEARKGKPLLTPEAFVAAHATEDGELLERLDALLALREAAPLPSLVDLSGVREFAGRRLVRVLGEGATGLVYEAEREDGTRTALKILNPLLMADGGRRDALLREARVAMALKHPGIVPVLDAGEDRGYTWLETALVDGPPLRELVEPGAPRAERVKLALEVGVQLADALNHAHKQGVVHRDLKPANVMRDADGFFKLIDFGLARVPGSAFSLSSTGDAIGTPLYMAPEQMRGERDVGPRADLYALGLLVLEVAQGRRLVAPRASLQTMARIASGRLQFGRRELAGLPKGLRRVLHRCLRPEPEERYPDAATLRDDLTAVAEGEPPQDARAPLGSVLARLARDRWVQVFFAAVIALVGLGLWYSRPVRLSPWRPVIWSGGTEVPENVVLEQTRLRDPQQRIVKVASANLLDYHGDLLVCGGRELFEGTGHWIQRIDLETRLVEHVELPDERFAFQPLVLGDSLYMPFGLSRRGADQLPTIWCINLTSGKGAGISNFPAVEELGRSHVAATAVHGKVFLAGGQVHSAGSQPNGEVWIADPTSLGGVVQTNPVQLEDLEEARWAAVAVASDGIVYVAGGSRSVGHAEACTMVESYAFALEGGMSTHGKIELAEAIAHPGVASGDGVIVLAGGSRDNVDNGDEESFEVDFIQLIELRTPTGPQVSVLEGRLSEPVSTPSTAIVGNQLVVCGNDFIDVFDLGTGQKTMALRVDLPSSMHAVAIGGKVYFIGFDNGELFRLTL